MAAPKLTSALLSLCLFHAVLTAAAPHPVPTVATPVEARAAAATTDHASSILSSLGSSTTDTAVVISAFESALRAATPTATQTDANAAASTLASLAASETNLFNFAIDLIEDGFVSSDEEAILGGASPAENSYNNTNNPTATCSIYPQRTSSDAPYDLPESSLREAVYFPSTFTFGQKPPVILFPGTAEPAGLTYADNYGKLLAQESYADPLWVNIPEFSLNDAQTTAEYASYAINYVSCLTNQNVSVITFSQGSIDVQWALKYWPSTRGYVSDFIALSPDFKGTKLADFLDALIGAIGSTPSILQQEYLSNFITQLRGSDGDSAYVPTTTVFSATDEIVEPQSPSSSASGNLLDVRNVGVSNTLLQEACPGTAAGTFALHEGLLYNALGYALATDALQNDGPGQVSRIDLGTVCAMAFSPGLELVDAINVEAGGIVAALSVLGYLPRVNAEPSIKGYATS